MNVREEAFSPRAGRRGSICLGDAFHHALRRPDDSRGSSLRLPRSGTSATESARSIDMLPRVAFRIMNKSDRRRGTLQFEGLTLIFLPTVKSPRREPSEIIVSILAEDAVLLIGGVPSRTCSDRPGMWMRFAIFWYDAGMICRMLISNSERGASCFGMLVTSMISSLGNSRLGMSAALQAMRYPYSTRSTDS